MNVNVEGHGNDEYNYPEPQGAKFPYNFQNSGGLLFEANHVRECLKRNLKESHLVSHKDSLIIAEIQQEIMDQIGVSYTK